MSTYIPIIVQLRETTQCSLTPITAALYNTPNTPFFSDSSNSLSFGTLLMYAHVHMTKRARTIIPSNEYAEIKIISKEVK